MNYKTVFIATGSSLVAAAGGMVGGYFLATKKLRAAFDAELKAQLIAAEKVFKIKHKVGMYASPVAMVQRVEDVMPAEGQTKEQLDAHVALYKSDSRITDQDLGRILTSLRKDEPYRPIGSPISGPPMNGNRNGSHDDDDQDSESINHTGSGSILGLSEDLEEATGDVNRNLFQDDDGPEWPNYSEYLEENPRSAGEPYIITVTEYDTGEMDYDQVSLAWFDEDGVEGLGVLADAQDIPIEDVDRVVGEKNMEKFGMWSGASGIVYIRNERLRTDFEVSRHRGSFAEAMGLKMPGKKSKRAPASARRSADG